MGASVQLRAEDEAGIDRMVASGRYPSREAVVAEGVRLLRAREDWFEMVRAQAEEGRAQIARGEGIPLDEAFDWLDARLAAR